MHKNDKPEIIAKSDIGLEKFNVDRIANIIWKAARAVGGEDKDLAFKRAEEVIDFLVTKYGEQIPSVSEVYDAIEKVLVERGHYKTAKALILERQQRELEKKREEIPIIDAEKLIDNYVSQYDWRVRENSNVAYSFPGLALHIIQSVISRYTQVKIYPPEIAKAHVSGDFHIHDLGFGIVGYCAGWSLKQLLYEGFNGVPGRVESKPAKHFDTALLQMVNFMGVLQNEWAGAQAFNSIDTLLAPFVRKDKLDYKQVKQNIQKFVYGLNITSRWGGQAPFTNITLDWKVPEDLKEQNVIYAGQILDETYADYQEEMDMINKAFIEVMIEGDMRGRVFTFPIPTYNISKDFDWDDEKTRLLFEMASKYGIPYFANFINSDLKPSDIRSMCCRLRLDLRELRRNVTGGLFGSGDNTGSIGVVTINMPRIGYLSKDESNFFERLENLMELARDSLEIKRKVLNRNLEMGLLPYTRRYLGTFDNHFSTIGLIGMHECCLNFLGVGIETKQGQEFAIKVLKFMRELISEFQEETGNIYNLEATPGEGTSYRLALLDKKEYPNIITSGKSNPYYTNSTQLPVGYTDDPIQAVLHQEPLQVLYTGGTVFHTFFGEKLSSWEVARDWVKRVFSNTRIPYLTITPTFSICPDHGYIAGEHWRCPTCGKECEVYSRVVGYIRPVRNWNAGKQEEFKERKTFSEEKVRAPRLFGQKTLERFARAE